jgi:hypothetical protein
MNESTTGCGDGAIFSTEALFGKCGGGLFTGALREKRDFVFIRGCVKEGSGNGHFSIRPDLC